jgi:hypothetical protein
MISARVHCHDSRLHRSTLWLCYPPEYGDYLSRTADPWLAMLLWPAMRLGQDLHVEATASARLVAAMPTLMTIMHCWDSRFRPVEIRTRTTSHEPKAGPAVASFFSGGVDSFYTALKNLAPATPAPARITHLISAQGLDVKLRDEVLWAQVRRSLQASAAHLGCTWVECATNVHELVQEEFMAWSMYYGAALAGLALGIRGLWNRVLIPAAQTYADLYPGGTHPLLDPLWSTESVHIVNDGAEATRIQKIRSQVARSPVALQHLRVCWENRDGRYNCGECEKCLRTMVSLKIAGVLDKCQSFDRPLSYKAVRSVRLRSPSQRVLMTQNYQAAQISGTDPALVRALRQCVHPSLARRLRYALSHQKRRGMELTKRVVLGGLRRGGRRGGQLAHSITPTPLSPAEGGRK